MGFIARAQQASDSSRVVLPARSPALGLPVEEAIAPLALLLEGLLVGILGFATGIGYQLAAFHNTGAPSVYVATGFIVALIYCGITRVVGGANKQGITSAVTRARSALTIWGATFLVLIAVAFAMKIGTTFSRGAIFSFFFTGVPAVMFGRIYIPRALANALSTNAYRGSEAIIAAPPSAMSAGDLASSLRAKGCDGVHMIEFNASCSVEDWPTTRRQLLKRLHDRARAAGPGVIYVVCDGVAAERIASIQAGLRLVPRAVFLVPPTDIAALFAQPLRRVGPTVAVETQRVPLSTMSRAIKRFIDVVAGSALLLLLVPAFVLIALAIKIDSEGPVFFLQRRNGYRGREFRIIKFRTMTVLEDGDVVPQAMRGDQRVTRVGAWLRKLSFDELPQLFNILRGQMSLVGPRPHAVAHDALYANVIENYELRQHVKPGVTGWAQVNGLRGETPTVELMWRRIEFDLWYASNCSVMLDLQILARTIFTVLLQINAY